MMPRFDVVVIGGGPAGTATALALHARGFATLVVEKTHYESPKPGETLFGDAQPILAALGVWDRFLSGRSITAATVVSVWGNADARARPPELNPYGPGWQLDRLWFDAMLAQAAEAAGALVYCGVRPTHVERVQTGWRVTVRGATTTEAAVNARYLVDATGRATWLARRMRSGTRRVDRLVGIVATYARPPAAPSLLVEAAPEGWWYSVPLPVSRGMAVYLTDADLVSGRPRAAFFRACLEMTEQTRHRLGPLGEPMIRVVPAQTSEQLSCVGDCWLAVGDAAYTLDPLSGSGICRALETGLRAAEAIAAGLRGKSSALAEYQLRETERFAAELRGRAYYYGLERRWPSSTFWGRRRQ